MWIERSLSGDYHNDERVVGRRRCNTNVNSMADTLQDLLEAKRQMLLAKRIIEDHGGELKIQSRFAQPNTGTTVSFFWSPPV